MGAMASQITSLPLFTPPFIQTQIKENINAPRHGTGEFPAQMASNAKMFPLDDVIMIAWRYLNSYLTTNLLDTWVA